MAGDLMQRSCPAGPYPVEVVIPVRWSLADSSSERVEEMGDYLRSLGTLVSGLTVVDGSDADAAALHRRAWAGAARIVPPEGPDDPDCWGPSAGAPANGKVRGAMTGVRLARHESVVLADDDVRLTPSDVAALVDALDDADLVRPVNTYDEWPWQARWDAARSLLAMAFGFDWPGVLALRRSVVLTAGGWSEQSMFENLELWRTIEAVGGRPRTAPEVVIDRRPPTVSHFRSQRVRQAYDDLAQPGRLIAELLVLPLAAVLGWRAFSAQPGATTARLLGVLALTGCVVTAERGRRRVGTHRVPPSVPFFAPAWLLERGVCVWLCVGARARGGVRYHGGRLRLAAHSTRQIRRHLRAQAHEQASAVGPGVRPRWRVNARQAGGIQCRPCPPVPW